MRRAESASDGKCDRARANPAVVPQIDELRAIELVRVVLDGQATAASRADGVIDVAHAAACELRLA